MKTTIEQHKGNQGVFLYVEETLTDGSLVYSIEGYRYYKDELKKVIEIAASDESNAATIWNGLVASCDICFS